MQLTTRARFRCPSCGAPSTCMIEVPEPNWGASDKMSDLGASDDTELTCSHCAEVFEGFVQNEASGCFVEIVGHREVQVDADYAFYAASQDNDPLWIDWEGPPDPFAVFMDSHYRADIILDEHGGDAGDDLFNRMLFAQQVSALEAYLGDTLVKAVLADDTVVARLIQQERDLADRKFTLSQIADEPDLVRNTVKAHLKEILYHNLGKVDVLYKIALGVPVLGPKEENEHLFRAVKLRHDCVHRNGYSPDGEPPSIFTKAFVHETAELLCRVVRRIELAVRARAAKA